MIGKLTSQVITTLVEGASLVNAIKDGSLKLAIKTAATSFAKNLKSLTTKLAQSTESVFELVKKVVKQTDGTYKITTVTDEVLEISEDVLKSDLINSGKSPEEADAAVQCLYDGCFSGETLVSTLLGLQRIDTIKEGDLVLSKDVETGKIRYNRVDRVYIKSSDVFYNLKTSKTENIKVTGSHLFFTSSGWWIAAENLKVDDQILTAQGTYEVVERVDSEELAAPELIYNLNVQNDHTYFVGTSGLLVHNDCTEEMTNAFDVTVKDAIASGVTDSQELIGLGNSVASELVSGFKWGDYLKGLIGNPPAGMIKPHAHHILFKEGLGAAQQALVVEGQQILIRYGIDPIKGIENLTWAPNIAGQHTIQSLEVVVEALRTIENAGGTKNQMVNKLIELGQLAANRN